MFVCQNCTNFFYLCPYVVDYGAGDRDRTGDIQLGKLTFYH